jgi:hypothetical protein
MRFVQNLSEKLGQHYVFSPPTEIHKFCDSFKISTKNFPEPTNHVEQPTTTTHHEPHKADVRPTHNPQWHQPRHDQEWRQIVDLDTMQPTNTQFVCGIRDPPYAAVCALRHHLPDHPRNGDVVIA